MKVPKTTVNTKTPNTNNPEHPWDNKRTCSNTRRKIKRILNERRKKPKRWFQGPYF